MYHSEYGQDRWLEENIFQGMRGLTFFEAGALNGLLHSNTLFFERERGWSGILMEANPKLMPDICRNRPKCWNFSGALSDKVGHADFLALDGGLYGWSGLSREMTPEHRANIRRDIPAQYQAHVPVVTRTLESVLKSAKASRIDYMSLDLEGAELKTLSVFPFHEYQIDVIGVEDHHDNPALGDLLTRNGYTRITRIGPDVIWRHAALPPADAAIHMDETP